VSESEAALLGALVGGAIVGLFGIGTTFLASYFLPLRLERKRAEAEDEKNWGPRKRLLTKMLSKPNPPIRTFTRLRHVTGTSDEDCRRLLIEIGARGVIMRGGTEGWALITRYDFNEPPVNEEAEDR
jgi:hypothetical protein